MKNLSLGTGDGLEESMQLIILGAEFSGTSDPLNQTISMQGT